MRRLCGCRRRTAPTTPTCSPTSPTPTSSPRFFLARACEAVLKQGRPWSDGEPARCGRDSLSLNDYVGYRPIALLETRPNTEYYPHEKVRPVPLLSRRRRASRRASTPTSFAPPSNCSRRPTAVLLDEASFNPDQLDELPSTRGPTITSTRSTSGRTCCSASGTRTPSTTAGYFRRFVLRQMTLDTLLTWVDPVTGPGRRQDRAALRGRGGAGRARS